MINPQGQHMQGIPGSIPAVSHGQGGFVFPGKPGRLPTEGEPGKAGVRPESGYGDFSFVRADPGRKKLFALELRFTLHGLDLNRPEKANCPENRQPQGVLLKCMDDH